ncbi:MAG: transcription-repair coupling factor, partial [Ignavibacteriales bacterium]
MSLVKIFHDSNEIKTVRKRVNECGDKIINCSPFAGSTKALFIKLLSEEFGQLVVLLPNIQQLHEIKVELEILGLNKLLLLFDELKPEQLQEKLAKLSDKQNCIVLAPYELLTLVLPAQHQLAKNTTMIQIGGNVGYNELIEYLNLLNYQKNKFVESVGDYAVRGSIIDFWSYSESNPCRIEFDGDFIESIRHFDAESQRSADKVERVSLTSSFELLDENFSSDIFDYLENPLVLAERYELNTFINGKEKGPVTVVTETLIEDEELSAELLGDKKFLISGASNKEEKNLESFEVDSDKLFSRNAKWLVEDPFTNPGSEFYLNITEPPVINSNYEFLFN